MTDNGDFIGDYRRPAFLAHQKNYKPMGRRDWFAAQMLSGVALTWVNAEHATTYAEVAVRLADALIAELDKPPSA